MAKRILLVWEYGAGRTHAEHLKQVGLRLQALGHDCLVLHFNTRFSAEFEALGLRSMQAPVWPPRLHTETPWPTYPGVSFLDALFNLGFGHEAVLNGILAHYDALFALWPPDLVIGDWGYGAGLAARGRAPFIAMGTSVSVPALDADGLPFSSKADGPHWLGDDATFTAMVNRVLTHWNRPPIQRPVDILATAARFCLNLPETDVEAEKRREPALPPIIPDWSPELKRGAADEIFVYVHAFNQGNEAMVAAFLALNARVRLYMPDQDPANAAVFEEAGLTVAHKAVPVPDIVARSKVVVHHGGPQLVALLLAVGIPQVILTKEGDNVVGGKSVERLGTGLAMWHQDVTVPWLIDAIEEASGPAMQARAAELAPHYAEILNSDPLTTVVNECLRLMGEA